MRCIDQTGIWTWNLDPARGLGARLNLVTARQSYGESANCTKKVDLHSRRDTCMAPRNGEYGVKSSPHPGSFNCSHATQAPIVKKNCILNSIGGHMPPKSPFAHIEGRWTGGRRPYCIKVTEPVWCVVPNSLADPYGCQCKEKMHTPIQNQDRKGCKSTLSIPK